MHNQIYPRCRAENVLITVARWLLTWMRSFLTSSAAAFADGALPRKSKQLIAVAVAHTTQCPYCIRSHTQAATREGATQREIMEAIWVAARFMRGGSGFAHSVIGLEVMSERVDPLTVASPAHRLGAAVFGRVAPRQLVRGGSAPRAAARRG